MHTFNPISSNPQTQGIVRHVLHPWAGELNSSDLAITMLMWCVRSQRRDAPPGGGRATWPKPPRLAPQPAWLMEQRSSEPRLPCREVVGSGRTSVTCTTPFVFCYSVAARARPACVTLVDYQRSLSASSPLPSNASWGARRLFGGRVSDNTAFWKRSCNYIPSKGIGSRSNKKDCESQSRLSSDSYYLNWNAPE